jgi:phosphoglycerate dehydrogenase-like enzyme
MLIFVIGIIPEKYYATADKAAFKEFLGRTDVLVCSVPSTSRTSGMIGRDELGESPYHQTEREEGCIAGTACLPKDAVVINVGRGDLIDTGTPISPVPGLTANLLHSDALLESLDSGHLLAACMDVTSPEPLPDNHPLYAHPRAIVTPHLSGDVENEMDEVVRMCVSAVGRWREGKGLWGVVDIEKGY